MQEVIISSNKIKALTVHFPVSDFSSEDERKNKAKEIAQKAIEIFVQKGIVSFAILVKKEDELIDID